MKNSEIHISAPNIYVPEGTDMGMFYEPSASTDKSIGTRNDRGIKDYEFELGGRRPFAEEVFRLKDWKHKTILDIGSGGHDRFGMEARAKGVRVVSLNPALRSSSARHNLSFGVDAYNHERANKLGLFALFARDKQSSSVAGLGQQIPFKDDSFDCAVSVYGVPNYLHYVDEEYSEATRAKDKALIAQSFNEIVRVLKPSGKAYLCELVNTIGGFSKSNGSEVTEILSEMEEMGIGAKAYQDSPRRLIVITKPEQATS